MATSSKQLLLISLTGAECSQELFSDKILLRTPVLMLHHLDLA
jgi:hypothetical protein